MSDATPSEELVALKPCPNPWCAPSEQLKPRVVWIGALEVVVECESCALVGPSASPVILNEDGEVIGTCDAEAEAIAAWNTRQAADLIESMSDVERKGEQSYEIDCPECGAEAHQLCSLDDGTPLPAMHGARRLSPRPDPRQDQVERVARALYRADFLQTCEIHGNKISSNFNFDWAWDQESSSPLSGPHFVAKWKGLARAAIASMDPVRQVAMQLREALREAREVVEVAGRVVNMDSNLRFIDAALASAAVLGEGE